MRLRDCRPKTQEAYSLVVRQFLDQLQQEPEELTDEDVREYFLYLREEKKMAPSTINIAVHGLRFFFIHTLHRDWPVFDLLRVNNPRKLPVVLSRDEVKSILSVIRHPVRRMALTTIYALGRGRQANGSQETTDLVRRSKRGSCRRTRFRRSPQMSSMKSPGH